MKTFLGAVFIVSFISVGSLQAQNTNHEAVSEVREQTEEGSIFVKLFGREDATNRERRRTLGIVVTVVIAVGVVVTNRIRLTRK